MTTMIWYEIVCWYGWNRLKERIETEYHYKFPSTSDIFFSTLHSYNNFNLYLWSYWNAFAVFHLSTIFRRRAIAKIIMWPKTECFWILRWYTFEWLHSLFPGIEWFTKLLMSQQWEFVFKHISKKIIRWLFAAHSEKSHNINWLCVIIRRMLWIW